MSEEVRPAIRFLSARSLNPSDIHCEIHESAVYGDKYMCKASGLHWVTKFKTGTRSLHDADHPGQARKGHCEAGFFFFYTGIHALVHRWYKNRCGKGIMVKSRDAVFLVLNKSLVIRIF